MSSNDDNQNNNKNNKKIIKPINVLNKNVSEITYIRRLPVLQPTYYDTTEINNLIDNIKIIDNTDDAFFWAHNNDLTTVMSDLKLRPLKTVVEDSHIDEKDVEFLDYDKGVIKSVGITVPFSRPGLTSYLSPILGQYGIKNKEFLEATVEGFHKITNGSFKEDFNTEEIETKGISNEDINTVVNLVAYKGGRWVLNTKFPINSSIYRIIPIRRRSLRKRIWDSRRNWKSILQIVTYHAKINKIEVDTERAKAIYKALRNSFHRKR